MDYLTQQFISVSNRLRKELTMLRQSIDSFRDQEERQYQEDQARSRLEQPPIRIQAEIQEPPAIASDKHSRENRNFGVQVALTLATLLTFVAAAIYAGIAKRQLCIFERQQATMDNTFKQVQEQTTLLTKQARVMIAVLRPTPGINPESAEVEIDLANDGRLPASDIRGDIEITKRMLPNDNAGNTIGHWVFYLPDLISNPATGPQSQKRLIYLSKMDVERIKQTQLTVRMQGEISYLNGLDADRKSIPVCYELVWVQTANGQVLDSGADVSRTARKAEDGS